MKYIVIESFAVSKPGIHPAVNDRIVHGITHSEPVDDDVDMLGQLVMGDVWIYTLHHEVDVLWQPADGKYYHNQDHHLHNLQHQQQQTSESNV